MNLHQELQFRKLQSETRRHFLKQCASGLGAVALGSMMGCNPFSTSKKEDIGLDIAKSLQQQLPHFAPNLACPPSSILR